MVIRGGGRGLEGSERRLFMKSFVCVPCHLAVAGRTDACFCVFKVCHRCRWGRSSFSAGKCSVQMIFLSLFQRQAPIQCSVQTILSSLFQRQAHTQSAHAKCCHVPTEKTTECFPALREYAPCVLHISFVSLLSMAAGTSILTRWLRYHDTL